MNFLFLVHYTLSCLVFNNLCCLSPQWSGADSICTVRKQSTNKKSLMQTFAVLESDEPIAAVNQLALYTC